MSEYLFTEAGQIQHSVGSIISGGVFTITSLPSTKMKIQNNGVFRGDLNISFSGGNMPGMVPGSVSGSGIISPTAQKNKTENLFVIRNNDSGNLNGTAEPISPPPPVVSVVIPCVCVDLQTKVRGD